MSTTAQALLDRNPKFARLVDLIQANSASDKSSIDSFHALEQAKLNLRKEKLTHLTYKSVYDEIQDYCIDAELNFHTSSAIALNSKEPDHQVVLRLIRAEESRIVLARHAAKQRLASTEPATDGLGLLGLSDVFNEYDDQDARFVADSVAQNLIVRMQSRVDIIKKFFRPNGFDSPSMANFVQVVSNIKAEVEDETRSLLIERQLTAKLEWEYFSLLTQVLQQLVDLLQVYKVGKQAQHDQVTIKWLQSKAQTMIRKLNVLQVQVLADTYTPSTVPTLQIIRKHLSAKIHSLDQQIAAASKQLERYEVVGAGFMALVAQYSALLEQMNDKHWALEQLAGPSTAQQPSRRSGK